MTTLVDSGYEVLGDRVKTTPRGFSADHPRIDLLRQKEVMVILPFGAADWIADERVLTHVRTCWRSVTPLVEWMQTIIPPLEGGATRC